MNKNFYFSLRTQYENLGDYLIAQATVDILSEFGNIYLDVRNVPQKYIDLFSLSSNVTIVKNGFITTILQSNKKNWYYIIKPGGYKNSVSLKKTIRILFMSIYFFISKSFFKIKILKMPHSFANTLNRIEFIFHKMITLNLCRDQQTFNLYDKFLLKNIALTSDLATFYINKKSKFLVRSENARVNIVISLRYDRLNNESVVAMEFANRLLKIKELENIIFVSQVTFDNKINIEMSKKYNTQYISYDITNESLNSIVNVYSEAKYIISNRLHVLLLGMINGAIPIAIIDQKKDQKIIGSLELLNISWFDKNDLKDVNSISEVLDETTSKYFANYESNLMEEFQGFFP